MLETPGSGNPWPYYYTSRWTRWLVGIFWLGRGGREYLRDLRYTRACKAGSVASNQASEMLRCKTGCMALRYSQPGRVSAALRGGGGGGSEVELETGAVAGGRGVEPASILYCCLMAVGPGRGRQRDVGSARMDRQPQVTTYGRGMCGRASRRSQATKFQKRARVGACDMQ